MGRYLKGTVDEDLQLSTLAAKTVVSVAFDESAVEKTLVSSIVAAYSMRGFTIASSDGPILVGLAHSDYTVTEIKEWIENPASWDPGDKIAQERAKRLIRKIGVFENTSADLGADVLNDGKPIKTKLNWSLTTGKTIQLWAYNMGSSALATTDPLVSAEGHANLWL